MEQETKYVCPKCAVRYTSTQKPEFCICGGKLETVPNQTLEDMKAMIDDFLTFGEVGKKLRR